MKRVIYIFLIICLVVLSTACFNKTSKDGLKFKKEYEEYNDKKSSSGKTYPKLNISKNNPIKYKSSEELADIIKNKTGVIYFGFPTCPWCRSALPALLEASEDAGINTIYYLNIKEERDTKKIDSNGKIIDVKKGSSGYNKLLEVLNDYLDDYTLKDDNGNEVKVGEKRIYVPLVVFVKEGKVLGIHSDTVASQKDPYQGLNDKQKEELKLIYYKQMIKIGDDMCDESC